MAKHMTPLEKVFGMTVKEAKARASKLTAREREAAQLLALGHTTRETAELMGCSFSSANQHRNNLRIKLDCSSIYGVTRIWLLSQLEAGS